MIILNLKMIVKKLGKQQFLDREATMATSAQCAQLQTRMLSGMWLRQIGVSAPGTLLRNVSSHVALCNCILGVLE